MKHNIENGGNANSSDPPVALSNEQKELLTEVIMQTQNSGAAITSPTPVDFYATLQVLGLVPFRCAECGMARLTDNKRMVGDGSELICDDCVAKKNPDIANQQRRFHDPGRENEWQYDSIGTYFPLDSLIDWLSEYENNLDSRERNLKKEQTRILTQTVASLRFPYRDPSLQNETSWFTHSWPSWDREADNNIRRTEESDSLFERYNELGAQLGFVSDIRKRVAALLSRCIDDNVYDYGFTLTDPLTHFLYEECIRDHPWHDRRGGVKQKHEAWAAKQEKRKALKQKVASRLWRESIDLSQLESENRWGPRPHVAPHTAVILCPDDNSGFDLIRHFADFSEEEQQGVLEGKFLVGYGQDALKKARIIIDEFNSVHYGEWYSVTTNTDYVVLDDTAVFVDRLGVLTVTAWQCGPEERRQYFLESELLEFVGHGEEARNKAWEIVNNRAQTPSQDGPTSEPA